MIVRSTIDLGRNLGLRVVAEGVESAKAWSRLAQLGCNIAQGYYLSRPVPAEELTQWLAARRRASALALSLGCGGFVRSGRTVARDQRAGEIPVGGDELAAVLLEAQVIRLHRPQRLAQEDEVGDPADQILDGGAPSRRAREQGAAVTCSCPQCHRPESGIR